ncbi:hypothetical protein CYY_006027 [Polysphondylium violaceum]|uniref:Armadillo repeat-containing protein n=1 Tax=Polysphondylium violaceum TaxID=133409 RepID=A0A8J4PSK9_9MYCE|nr:hypothetical protein CYY_006027 [Polysphondylium violaceum]
MEITTDTTMDSNNSPGYQPDSPDYYPETPDYHPDSPNYQPNSPDYQPDSPSFDLPSRFDNISITDLQEIETNLNQIANEIIESSSLDVLSPAVVKIKKFSVGSKINVILNCNSKLFPKLIDLLNNSDDYPSFQFEIIWILLNVFAGTLEQAEYLVQLNVLPILKRILERTTDENLLIQILWCISNVAAEKSLCKLLFDVGIFHSLLPLLQNMTNSSKELLEQLSGVLCNLIVRGSPGNALSQLALPFLHRFIYCSHNGVVKNGCSGLIGVFKEDNSSDQQIQTYLNDCNPGPRLLALLATSKDPKVVRKSLEAIGSILVRRQQQVQYLLDCTFDHNGSAFGLLDGIRCCLKLPSKDIRKVATWALSNLAVDNTQLLIDSKMMDIVIDHLLLDPAVNVRVEAMWTICNALISKQNSFYFSHKMAHIKTTLTNELSKNEIQKPEHLDLIKFIVNHTYK